MHFKCEHCQKTFVSIGKIRHHMKVIHLKRGDLDKHVEKSVKKRTFTKNECLECALTFSTKVELLKHRNEKHMNSEDLRCKICLKMCTNQGCLRQHIKFKHEKVPPKVVCPECDLEFRFTSDLRRHAKVHERREELKLECHHCSFKAVARRVLLQHYNKEHLLDMTTHQIHFSTSREFLEWKQSYSEETRADFINSGKAWKKKDGTKSIVYSCSREGLYRPSGQNKRKMKSSGSIKIGGHCPARIKAIYNTDGTVDVFYVKTHVGHSLDITRLSLSKAEKDLIVEKLSKNVSMDTILEEVRESLVSDNNIRRIHLLTRKDLINITKSYQLDKGKKVGNDWRDMTIWRNVDAWVAYVRSSSSIIRFYKAKNQILEEFPVLREKDFILILMNNDQLEMLKRYGNDCICVDAIDGLSNADLQLYTIMVVDYLSQGFPVAFMFTNRRDISSMEIFFKTIKMCLHETIITPNTFMSIMDEKCYQTWSTIIGPSENRLYCSWHVDQAFRTNLNKIKNKEKRLSVYKRLKMIMVETNFELFSQLTWNLLTELLNDPEMKEFGLYFEKLKQAASGWAYCYRTNIGLISNMHIENMHSMLKSIFLQEKKEKKIDKAVLALMGYIRSELLNLYMFADQVSFCAKLTEIKVRHDASKALPLEGIIENGTGGWRISSMRSYDSFDVELGNLRCRCTMRCFECDACIHTYRCTCADSSLEWNMCEHAHAVCRYIAIRRAEPPPPPPIPMPDSPPLHSPPERHISEDPDDPEPMDRMAVARQDVDRILSLISSEDRFQLFRKHMASLEDALKSCP